MERIWRGAGRLLGIGALVVVVAFVVAKGLDGDDTDLAVGLLALWPWVGLGAAVAGVATVLLGARRLAAALTAVALGCLAALAPRTVGSREAPADDERLVVMTVNLRFGKADTAQLARLVAERDVDVLVAQEVTPGTFDTARGTELDRLLPHHAGRVPSRRAHETTGAYGAVVWSREEVRETSAVRGTARYSPRVVVGTALGPVLVADVHTTSPVGGREARWHADLDAVARACGERPTLPGPRPVGTVVAGDLNGSTDHPSIRSAVERCGLTDAADAAGHGLDATWAGTPANPVPLVRTSFVLTDLVVVDTSTAPLGGTDHRAVLATLARR